MENSALDENARLAKASWLRIDPGRLRDFIAGHTELERSWQRLRARR
jgi:hypothetical protein